MGIGPQVSQPQMSSVLSDVAQLWADAADKSARLWAQLNGAGGTAYLTAAPPGYDSGDAAAIMTLAGQLNQCAGLLNGTGTLTAAFNFLGAFAVVLDPQDITSG